MTRTIVVSQIGARMHYAVPRMAHARGRLERLYTDICAAKGWPRLLGALPPSQTPAPLRRLAGRMPTGIPPEKIATFDMMGLFSVLRRMRSRSRSAETAEMVRLAESFSRRVAAQGFGGAEGFYGIAAECVEQIEAARRRGMWTVVEQIIAPRVTVEELVAAEAEKFPDWQADRGTDRFAPAFADRERAEWAAADLVICPSEFVRRTVEEAGGPAEKCVVVPYGVDARFGAVTRRGEGGPLRVLTVGAVGLRKGAPYVCEAARRLRGVVDFRMVGPLDIPDGVRRLLADALDLRGQVPRREVLSHFAWADVFLLPSVCEGSATVIYEAMAAGLPVVTTPHSGSVVRPGVDGFVVPVGDGEAVAEKLERLHRDRELLAAMAQAARRQAGLYDLENYSARLFAVLDRLRGSARPATTGVSGKVMA